MTTAAAVQYVWVATGGFCTVCIVAILDMLIAPAWEERWSEKLSVVVPLAFSAAVLAVVLVAVLS